MALPSDKPPSYEEATGQSIAPVEVDEADEAMDCTVASASATSLPCPLHVTPAPDNSAGPSTSSLPSTLPAQAVDCSMSKALDLAKCQETCNKSPCPPPAGWVLDPATAKALEAGASKAEEAGESSSQEKPQPSSAANNEATSTAPLPWGNNSLYPNGALANEASGTWGTPSLSAACPPGFEPALGLTALILRETMNNTEQGTQRGAVVLQSTGAPMFLLKRTRAHTRTRTRGLELLDAAGSQVIATLESTKRADVLSVEVLCPPGSRIARVETRTDIASESLAASIMNAAEQPVFRLMMPQLGSIETQPTQQVVSVSSGGSVGSIEWAWGLEADLFEVRINVPSDLDVRMKIALITLCALHMEAFSRRWSPGKDVGHKHKRRHHHHHHHSRHHR